MKTISYKFVEFIPDLLEEGVIYISTKYCTAVHKCCCRCQEEVVTPLSPVDWRFTFDGKSISLYPSIGNWSLPCKSHYWIEKNRVIWSDKWSDSRIKTLQKTEQKYKEQYFKKANKKWHWPWQK